MKKIVTFLVLSVIIEYSYAQSCEIYRIKCIGEIKSESLKIQKIKLPTMGFLYGTEKENPRNEFVEIESNKINAILLGFQYLSDIPKNLLEFLKEKREKIPIIIIVQEGTKIKEMLVEITWDNIQIEKVENDTFGELFELNLNEIDL